MEARQPALKAPPAALENFALKLIPPEARETVAGDLRERYVSPKRYLLEIFQTAPFIVASQIRRSANFPLLGLQAFLIFAGSGGLDASATDPLSLFIPGLTTMVALCGLLFLGAYMGSRRLSPRGAILETVIVFGALLFYADGSLFHLQNTHRVGDNASAGSIFVILGWFTLPVICGLRTLMILSRMKGDAQIWSPASPADLERDFAGFRAMAHWRARRDALMLLGVAGLSLWCGSDLPGLEPIISSLAFVYVVIAAYLWFAGAPRPLTRKGDFVTLQCVYQKELLRQDQQRRLVWWLLPTPLLLAIQFWISGTGGMSENPLANLYGLVATILICLSVAIINRESNGETRERVTRLARMREQSVA